MAQENFLVPALARAVARWMPVSCPAPIRCLVLTVYFGLCPLGETLFLTMVEGTLVQFLVCRYTVILSRVIQDCVRSEVPRLQLQGPVVAKGQVARGQQR